MSKHYRQGDILVLERDTIDVSNLALVPLENNEVVIAHGEATGHRHRFKKDSVDLFESPGIPAQSERILHAKELLAKLNHDEHDTIELPQGQYDVIRQSEYVPNKPMRIVSD